jgi:tetratricopeptide (TPR) repeat protein
LLVGGPDRDTSFNLANVLYNLGRREQAAERYRQVLELDAEFVEAWNNLGNVLTELGETEEAISALERALHCDPHYADAHYNLAGVLDQSGRGAEAVEHWRAYLARDHVSRWADHARRRLRAGK